MMFVHMLPILLDSGSEDSVAPMGIEMSPHREAQQSKPCWPRTVAMRRGIVPVPRGLYCGMNARWHELRAGSHTVDRLFLFDIFPIRSAGNIDPDLWMPWFGPAPKRTGAIGTERIPDECSVQAEGKPARQRGGQQSHVRSPNGSKFGGLVLCYNCAICRPAARISLQAAEGGVFLWSARFGADSRPPLGAVQSPCWLHPGERRRWGGMGITRCALQGKARQGLVGVLSWKEGGAATTRPYSHIDITPTHNVRGSGHPPDKIIETPNP
jgi:hypothetical protein